jgi:hypothetical protein
MVRSDGGTHHASIQDLQLPLGRYEPERLLSQETTMKTIIALATLALVLAVGTATVMVVQPQPAMACTGQNC